MVTMHGTCVLISGIGVLLRGDPGSGKSDVALRLIDGGARLVADDQVILRAENGRLIASAPASLAGLLEVRGVGIMPVPSVPTAEVGLLVDLVRQDQVERLPDAACEQVLSIPIPRLALSPFDAATPAKLRLAATAARAGTLGEVPSAMATLP
jgi:HPr kinase/phosphorylase